MVALKDLTRISEYEWEIPKTYRADMRVPVRLFATRKLLEKVMEDASLDQAVNASTLPGLVGHVVVMPDMHQGYGFPIGGIAATRVQDGVISPGAIGYDINCLTGDAQVLHEHGYTRRIEEMAGDWPEASLVCFHLGTPEQIKLDHARPIRWFGQPVHARVFKLVTENGHEVKATSDHPFLTEAGMLPLDKLQIGQRVALYGYYGVDYEQPEDQLVITEKQMEAYLLRLGKGENGHALSQIMNLLRSKDLLPLSYASPAIPILCKLLGFVFGDGNVRFDRRSNKGMVAFYGQPIDLEDIRSDLASLGFKPSRVWSRRRSHHIQTTYDEYHFENTEHWVAVNSSALAALLSCLGAPLGNKAMQDYDLPAWLEKAPRWQKRLFLAALFGAELSAPQSVSGHGCNLAAPTLSMNKREKCVGSGRAFIQHLKDWLGLFGVNTRPTGERFEQANQDGSRSLRLRLIVDADPGNLMRLWGRVGFEYNRKRRALASVAVEYLALKQRRIRQRQEIAEQTLVLAHSGLGAEEIYTQLAGQAANRRFIERSLYRDRKGAPRIGDGFPTFEQFKNEATSGLGDSGMVWDRVMHIEPCEYDGLVYDFTMDHVDHNFTANGFVVSNCGVRLLASQIDADQVSDQLDDLATSLNQHCPSGVGVEGQVKMSNAQLDEVCRQGSRWALKQGYATENDLRRTEEGGRLEGADPDRVSKRAKERGRPQVGTLGAGNHFIEVDIVEQIFDAQAAQAMGLAEGRLVLQIHCGSRGFGHQICSDYVEDFQEAVRRYKIELPDRELVCAPLKSPEGQSYLAAMRCAANYAFANRQLLAHQARLAFEQVLAGKVPNWNLTQVYDIAHNMGKIETHRIDGKEIQVCVHRKGATRAFGPGAPGLPDEYRLTGQPVLVPGSMGTASWVLVGTETSMQQSFGSSCHGAGRVMSRAKAKKEVRGDKLRQELESEGIHVRAGSMAGLAEEAPRAYKDVDSVVETVAGAQIARKVARLVPVAVVKG